VAGEELAADCSGSLPFCADKDPFQQTLRIIAFPAFPPDTPFSLDLTFAQGTLKTPANIGNI
jgi:hypothetical protein